MENGAVSHARYSLGTRTQVKKTTKNFIAMVVVFNTHFDVECGREENMVKNLDKR